MGTIETVFRPIISVNLLSIYGAVLDLCDEYSACQARTGRPVLARQSDHCSSEQVCWWQHHRPKFLHKKIFCKSTKNEWKGSHKQNRVMKICTDARFLTTVDVGQYFMTKDTEESSQITEPVTCREYTLPRDEQSSDPKGWIRGNTKIGPVLEVINSNQQGKYGVEIRIEPVDKDNSHSWVRISHGLNKLVTDLIDKEYDDNEQKTSEMKSEEFALKTNVFAFASRSKAEAKPRRRTLACSSTRTVPIGERTWTDI